MLYNARWIDAVILYDVELKQKQKQKLDSMKLIQSVNSQFILLSRILV